MGTVCLSTTIHEVQTYKSKGVAGKFVEAQVTRDVSENFGTTRQTYWKKNDGKGRSKNGLPVKSLTDTGTMISIIARKHLKE